VTLAWPWFGVHLVSSVFVFVVGVRAEKRSCNSGSRFVR
jgi:hypothetical protein